MWNFKASCSNEKIIVNKLRLNNSVILKATGSSMFPLFNSKTIFICKRKRYIYPGQLALINEKNDLYIHRILFQGYNISISWGDNIIFPHIHKSSSIIAKAIPFKNSFISKIPGFFILLVIPFLKMIIEGYKFVKKKN